MKKSLTRPAALLALLLLMLILLPIRTQATENECCKNQICTDKICSLKAAERKLWIEHVLWTRNYIVSDLSSLEDKAPVLERLLKNQQDIGESIKPFFGEEAAKELTDLLKEHIALGGQVIDAAKNNNKPDLEKYNKLWYENADKISNYLSSINPKYSNKVLKDMLYKHLQFVTDQVTSYLSKDWETHIDAYDKGQEHMINFADILVDGIVKQFPKEFK